MNVSDCTESLLGVGEVSGRPQGIGETFESSTRRSARMDSAKRVSRDLSVEATTLSSAAPGRLHSASLVTSGNVGFGARRCVMVVNPRHHLEPRSEAVFGDPEPLCRAVEVGICQRFVSA